MNCIHFVEGWNVSKYGIPQLVSEEVLYCDHTLDLKIALFILFIFVGILSFYLIKIINKRGGKSVK